MTGTVGAYPSSSRRRPHLRHLGAHQLEEPAQRRLLVAASRLDRVVKGTDRLLASSGQPAAEVRAALRELVPEYRPPGEGG